MHGPGTAPPPRRWQDMRRLLWLGLGLCAIASLWKFEAEEDGPAVALSPFLAALALEAGIFLLRRHQNQLLAANKS